MKLRIFMVTTAVSLSFSVGYLLGALSHFESGYEIGFNDVERLIKVELSNPSPIFWVGNIRFETVNTKRGYFKVTSNERSM